MYIEKINILKSPEVMLKAELVNYYGLLDLKFYYFYKINGSVRLKTK